MTEEATPDEERRRGAPRRRLPHLARAPAPEPNAALKEVVMPMPVRLIPIPLLALTFTLASPLLAQGNGNGNGPGGGGGGPGGGGGGSGDCVTAPSGMLDPVVIGYRNILSDHPTPGHWPEGAATPYRHPAQLCSDGTGLGDIHAVSLQGDLRRNPDAGCAGDPRWILDTRYALGGSVVLIACEEALFDDVNPSWVYDPAEDDIAGADGVMDYVLLDLLALDMYIWKVAWSQDMQHVAIAGSLISTGEKLIYVGDVPWVNCVPGTIINVSLVATGVTDPSWGAGDKLAYGARDGRPEFASADEGPIYVWDHAMSTETRLEYSPGVPIIGGDPEISPDGTRVAYSRLVGPERAEIFVFEFDANMITGTETQSSNPSRLNGEYIRHPTWSPDGTQFLLDKMVRSQGVTYRYAYRMDVTGNKKAKRLTNDHGLDDGFVPIAWR